MLETSDFPAVLAHAESTAAQQGLEHFGLEIPMENQAAADYLLDHGYRMDSLSLS